MQTTHMQIQSGTTVYGSDGEKIGDVAEVANNYFVIEKGFIYTEDIFIPMSLVSRHRDGDDAIDLTISKDELESGDWSSPPTAATGATGATAATAATGTDRDVLERREERLQVDKHTEKAGDVRVGKHVVEEEQSVDVPVSREEVTLERRSVDRPATGTTTSADEIDMPVYEERVEAGKSAHVVEELEVGKTAKTGTERVSGTVRKEEFDIDDETNRP